MRFKYRGKIVVMLTENNHPKDIVYVAIKILNGLNTSKIYEIIL